MDPLMGQAKPRAFLGEHPTLQGNIQQNPGYLHKFKRYILILQRLHPTDREHAATSEIGSMLHRYLHEIYPRPPEACG